MNAKDFILEYGLTLEKNPSRSPDKDVVVTLSKGVVVLNEPAIDTMELEDYPNLEIYTGAQSGATIIAFSGLEGETTNSVKVEIKTTGKKKVKKATVSLKGVLFKFGVSSNKAHVVDLVSCESRSLVFAIIGTQKMEIEDGQKQTTAPYGDVLMGTVGTEGERTRGSDF